VYDHGSLFTQFINITHASIINSKEFKMQRGEYKIYLPL